MDYSELEKITYGNDSITSVDKTKNCYVTYDSSTTNGNSDFTLWQPSWEFYNNYQFDYKYQPTPATPATPVEDQINKEQPKQQIKKEIKRKDRFELLDFS